MKAICKIHFGDLNQTIHVLNEEDDIVNTYKVRTGKYNKGWRVKTEKGRGYVNCIIHNATNYQLTHLLENGHRIVGRDGRIKGNAKKFIHIKPVEEKSVKMFERNVEQIIRNGG